MSDERRYSEEEIAAIFEEATKAQKAARQEPHREGLTLEELQAIGLDAGITPDFIAHAAAKLHQLHPAEEASPPKTHFGIPVTVERTIALPRPLSADEWERFVVDLRETFRANGKVEGHGGLRRWYNGNLQAIVEPTDTGHRLRLRTLHENARNGLSGGLVLMLLSVMMAVLMLSQGDSLLAWRSIMVFLLFLGPGAAMMGYNAHLLPRWANTRAKQMDGLTARLMERMNASTASPVATPSSVSATATPTPEAPAPRLDLPDAAEAPMPDQRASTRTRT